MIIITDKNLYKSLLYFILKEEKIIEPYLNRLFYFAQLKQMYNFMGKRFLKTEILF